MPLLGPPAVVGDASGECDTAVGDVWGGGAIIEFFFAALMMSLYVIGDWGDWGISGSLGAASGVRSTGAGEGVAWSRELKLLSSGLLLFLTMLRVLVAPLCAPLSSDVGVIGVLGGESTSLLSRTASREYVLPLAYGSMFRKGGLLLVGRKVETRLLVRFGWCSEEIDPVGVEDRSIEDTVEYTLERFLVWPEFGDIDLRGVGSSMMEGFPAKTNDTALAVTS